MTIPETDFDKIIRAQGVDRRVVEVYKLLKEYKDAPERAAWLKRRTKAWDAIENEMWDDKEKKAMEAEGQIPLVINKCVKGVQGSCAIVTDQKPEIKFHPIGSGDLYVSELLKRGHDVVWTKNEGSDATYDVVEEAKIGGIGFFDAKHEPSKGPFGRVIFEESPPDDFYWSKNSRKRDLSDTPILKAKLRTIEYIKENYDNITDQDLVYESSLKEDTAKSSGVTGADNYTIENESKDSDSITTEKQKQVWEIEAWLLKTEREDWFVKTQPDGTPLTSRMELPKGVKPEDFAISQGGHHWPRKVQKRILRVIVGKKLISEEANPYGEDSDGDPILPCIGLRHQRTRNAYPMSPTMYAQPINKEKNKRRAQFVHAISHNVNAPIMEPADQVKWTGDGNPGTPGTRGQVSDNAAFQPYRLQSGSFEAKQFLDIEMIGDKDIDDQYDIHDVLRGKVPPGQGKIAERTVLALQDMGGMMSKPFLRSLESALVRLSRVNLAMMFKHWKRYMWERLLEPDEKGQLPVPEDLKESMETYREEEPDKAEELIKLKYQEALEKICPKSGEPAISMLDIDIRIAAGSSMPTNRMAKGAVAIEYVNAGIYDPEAALEYIDDPNKEKIVARLKEREAMELEQGMASKK